MDRHRNTTACMQHHDMHAHGDARQLGMWAAMRRTFSAMHILTVKQDVCSWMCH
jgi:hypothetical protein